MTLTNLPTLLFVPGNQPARFDKALASGAPGIVLDLEDAVTVNEKDLARQQVFDWLRQSSPSPAATRPWRAVRLNARQGPYFEADDAAFTESLCHGHAPDLVVLPKVEAAAEIEDCLRRWQATGATVPPVLALIETALGVEQVAAIARVPGVAGLGFGAADLSADMGCEMAWEPLLYARGRVAHAAALARVALLDVPHLALDDEAGLRADALRAKAMGFTGKLAIHPRQVAPIRDCFMPTAQQITQAQAIVDAAARSAGQVCVVDGRMVDEPVVRAARLTLARAGVGH